MQLASLVAVLAAALSVSAHFTLTTPPTRGFDELVEDVGPCGGFDTPSATRAVFSSSSNITVRFADSKGSASVKLAVGEAPAAFPITLGSVELSKRGVYNLPFDLSAVGVSNNGASATIQISISSSHGTLFQCSDVVLAL
ncbi:hypothetical protein HK105_206184 [Polyrhizophydium stewartii]|uniref:Copper acquisition factor BIM1-like domain-containing protein n=1 Tax=Polyrhizophydium stewartii TaxID=2732419 RepID=A0ABR4N435_9FUNG